MPTSPSSGFDEYLRMSETIKLSICLATYNRGKFIGETLDSILSQMHSGIELIVVDGASPDNTPEIMAQYVLRYPQIRYYREQENSGIDKDYDKAVGYAVGEYCWLMTDDDLLQPKAVARVLDALKEKPELVVVNAEIRNANLSGVLQSRRWQIIEDRQYKTGETAAFFREAGDYLSFIGAVIIRREYWLARERTSYFGTLFIHFGVIFQREPIKNIYAIAEPLIVIRYGNAMWTSRGFEIWMFKWPQLVWSFNDFSKDDKEIICPLEPWRNLRKLIFLRATGAYSFSEFRTHISPRLHGANWLRACSISMFPAKLTNLLYIGYFALKNRADHMAWYELLRCSCASGPGRWIARFARRQEYDLWKHGLAQPACSITK